MSAFVYGVHLSHFSKATQSFLRKFYLLQRIFPILCEPSFGEKLFTNSSLQQTNSFSNDTEITSTVQSTNKPTLAIEKWVRQKVCFFLLLFQISYKRFESNRNHFAFFLFCRDEPCKTP